jgi:hypothetical protein
VASLALQPRPAKSVLARELDPRSALPYAWHVTDQIIALDTQALMVSFQLDGASFETADVRDLNDWQPWWELPVSLRRRARRAIPRAT